MDIPMSGSHNPVRDSSITLLAEALRNSSIPRSGLWDSRPMAPWSRFGFASRPAKAGRSAYGRYRRWAASPGHIWKARRSSIGRTTVRGSRTIRLLQEIRFSFRTARRILNGPIFTAPAGLHSHFPLWAPDDRFIYIVYGALPDKLDIWRIKPTGGMPERITSHNGRVSHPVLLNRRTLMYLASDPDGSGPWLYSIDVERRIPHRLTFGPDRYTSLAATADGKRLVVTRASPKSTLWRMRIGDSSAELASRLESP